MATTKTVRAAESVPDGFDALQRRFLSLTSRLEEDIEEWHSDHEHTPNAKEVQS
jgi:hypothetical protein